MSRDFTFIDDITDGILSIMTKSDFKREIYKIYNIGNNKPVKLIEFIETLENLLSKKAIKKYLHIH